MASHVTVGSCAWGIHVYSILAPLLFKYTLLWNYSRKQRHVLQHFLNSFHNCEYKTTIHVGVVIQPSFTV